MLSKMKSRMCIWVTKLDAGQPHGEENLPRVFQMGHPPRGVILAGTCDQRGGSHVEERMKMSGNSIHVETFLEQNKNKIKM